MSANATATQRRPDRRQLWQQLPEKTYDLLIVGGGVNGAGVARDAAQRGLSVALLEKGDFGSGTSFRSSKLIHGGLRYLETYQFGLVRESTAERAVQMRVAPHLARPMPFMFPVYKKDPHGLLFMDMGLWLYDALGLFRTPRLHRAYREQGVLKREPALRSKGLIGGLHYFDCATDDGRLTLENVLDAISLGAHAVNYVSVDELIRSADGRFVGAVVTDRIDGSRAEVRANMVCCTAGPWIDAFVAQATGRTSRLLHPTRGSHLVFSRRDVPVENAVVLLAVEDQRPLFAIPWKDHTYVGTTDVEHDGGPDAVFPSRDEVRYILETINRYFPAITVDQSSVRGSWAGLRPLLEDPEAQSTAKISREHELIGGEDGLLILAGGKLTTYRLMAKETVDRVLQLLTETGRVPADLQACRTKQRPLPGGVGLPEKGGTKARVADLCERHHLSLRKADHLLSVYGGRAGQVLQGADNAARQAIVEGLDHIWAEVDFAVRAEMAVTLLDVLVRRTLIGLKEARASLQVASAVADRMARRLGWNDARIARELQSYRAWIRNTLQCVEAE
jgi:glycerol-3-phosphate dehydrogenase